MIESNDQIIQKIIHNSHFQQSFLVFIQISFDGNPNELNWNHPFVSIFDKKRKQEKHIFIHKNNQKFSHHSYSIKINSFLYIELNITRCTIIHSISKFVDTIWVTLMSRNKSI